MLRQRRRRLAHRRLPWRLIGARLLVRHSGHSGRPRDIRGDIAKPKGCSISAMHADPHLWAIGTVQRMKIHYGVGGMRSGDVALRLSIVLSVACFIALAAGLYEIDRREKSSSATVDRNLVEIEQRNQILSNQIHVLAAQLSASERQLQALSSRVQALSDQYESRLTETERQIEVVSGRYDAWLKELEDDLRARRLESAPVPR
jgi:hypothetical protein